jgi:hypothetical protein
VLGVFGHTDEGSFFDEKIPYPFNPHLGFPGQDEDNVLLSFMNVYRDFFSRRQLYQKNGNISPVIFLVEEILDLDREKGVRLPGQILLSFHGIHSSSSIGKLIGVEK